MVSETKPIINIQNVIFNVIFINVLVTPSLETNDVINDVIKTLFYDVEFICVLHSLHDLIHYHTALFAL